ncbi:MAG: alkane 1-monooxygenase [Lutibacter sp.]|uniref:alkane 1-monooxygenase n=1 Tax=Lutibacter sp. TaxID=1925666 RepID=UPI003858607C
MNKLKYLSVFILAFTAYISFTNYGIWTYSPIIFSFVLIPILELFFKPNNKNSSLDAKKELKKDRYFNIVLFTTVPIQIGFVIFFLFAIQEELKPYEIIGRISSLGILCGILGINVGHELGHRTNRFQQFLGEILLLTSLETHFLPYHNSGHHYNVATPKDPATARKGELVFTFWFRSQIGSYFQAWKIETNKLKKKGKYFLSFSNSMLIYSIAQIILLFTIYFIFNIEVVLAFLAASIFGILMLETVNYIEHYGLLRKLKENGNYERVQPSHSWNSNHIVGRSILFELSRHSDHHFKANKQYQLLDSLPNSPQMITGYPGMMLLALVPPLWFKIMHKQL